MSTQLWFLNNLATVLVNEPTLSIVELTGAPGDAPPLHLHADEDETFYVLDGEVTVHIAGRDPIVLRAGQAAFAPRGVPHVYVDAVAARHGIELLGPPGPLPQAPGLAATAR